MKRIFSIIGVGILSTLFIFCPLSPRKASAIGCKDVNLVFARGSSQNSPASRDPIYNIIGWHVEGGKIIYDRGNDFTGLEKESATYFTGIGNRVLAEYPTLSMQFVSLHDFAGKYNDYGYLAVPAFGTADTAFLSRNAVDARFGYNSIVGESTYGDYRQSVQNGAQELAGYLADEMTRCPSQYTVLGGYSQGAQVVGDAMALMHTRGQDTLLSRLGHVDLFGDPKFNGFQLDTNRLNIFQQHSIYPWVRGTASLNEVGALGPRQPYVPDILTAQTSSWCDFNDVVCGGFAGLSATDPKAHQHVYSDSGGWIEKASNETYIAMKQRLSLLAGLPDKSANSPLAYWPGIEKPSKLDAMFVMDQTGDENLSLSPDSDYLSNNFGYLANHIAPDGTTSDYYSSIHAGVETFTEYQVGDSIISHPTNPVSLTEDVFGANSYFESGWAQAHFLGNYYGGVDLQDSPFSAINAALDQSWRSDARKVIVVFSNSWGKDIESGTNLTMKQITDKARAKKVEILPVFTSRTFRADETKVQNVPAANAFYAAMAKQSGGHATEVTDRLSRTLVYDVIMGHVFAPTIDISTTNPIGKKTTTATTKPAKPVVKKGSKVVLSAGKSNSPKSVIKHYAWDVNGDGTTDYSSDTPYVEPTFDTTGTTTVCVTATDAMNVSSTGCQDVTVTDDDSQVTDAAPLVLPAPSFVTTRSGSDAVITWPSVSGSIIIKDADGAVIAIADGQSGTFTLHGVPTDAFTLSAQLVNGNDASVPVILHIDALVVPTTIIETTGTGTGAGGAGNNSGGTSPVVPPATDTPTEAVLGATSDSGNVLTHDESDAASVEPLAVTTDTAVLMPNSADMILGSASKATQSNADQDQTIGQGTKKVLVAATNDLSEVVQDFLAWLILVVLLLILLRQLTKKRDQNTYKYDQQKRFAPRKLVLQT